MGDAPFSEKLFELFLRASRMVARGHHHRARAHPGQARLLSVMAEHAPVTQRALADLLQIRSASLSEILMKLEKSGAVVREKDEEDRRNVIVSLTRHGREMLAENAREGGRTAEVLFAALDEDEKKRLAELLEKLLTSWLSERDEHMRCFRDGHGRGRHEPGGCDRHGFGRGRGGRFNG